MGDLPRTIGPYRILEMLGRGGMGIVYRAEHRDSGCVAAVKTVRVPSQGMLSSIRREVHALSRIRHPGIVRILDQGLDGGLPWYAMELLDGRTLRCLRRDDHGDSSTVSQLDGPGPTGATLPSRNLEGWWTQQLRSPTPHFGPLPRIQRLEGRQRRGPGAARRSAVAPRHPGGLRPGETRPPGTPVDDSELLESLTLVRSLCSPLAFLHGEGIVHRDLKPDNILIRADGLPVLVDFGLVAQFAAELSREALELGTGPAGTVAYMPPEQARGELVDARADLYAVGCILYELITGRPPFVGRSPSDVLRQHIELEPSAPSTLVDGVSSELDELVLRLLAKDRRLRIGHADDVAAALARLGAKDGSANAAPRPRAHLYRPALAGREVALRGLDEALDRLENRSGGLVLIGGESGVGKTRLVMEIVQRAERRNLVVLTGACQDTAARPLDAFHRPLEAIADRCRELGKQETDRLLGPRGRLLAQYEAALVGLPGQEVYPEPAELPAEAARRRLFGALLHCFSALAEGRPLLLAVDDLQWADELTVGFLDHWLRTRSTNAQAAPPLLVVGTYRSEEVGGRDALALRGLIAEPEVIRIQLARLGEADVASIVGDMLALSPAPEVFSGYLASQSEGNPFFVAEYLRAAVTEELLWRDDQGQWHVGSEQGTATKADYERLPLPGSLRDLVQRRLRGLPHSALGLAQAAAVLGRECDVGLIQRMMRLSEPELLEATAELIRRQALEDSGEGFLHFVHDKIREVAYSGLASGRRVELHRAAAEAIESTHEANPHLAALGHHWEQAGELGKARTCYLEGAHQARRRYAHAEAERLFRAALRLSPAPDTHSLQARTDLGEILQAQGRPVEALAEHSQALLEARAIGDRVFAGRSLLRIGVSHLRTGEMDSAAQLHNEALAIARELGERRDEAMALLCLGILQLDQGRFEAARANFAEALEISRELGERRLEGALLGNLATSYGDQGSPEARDLHEQALALHREIGDRPSEGIDLGNLALAEHNRGNPVAERLYEQALEVHREIGNRRDEGIVLVSFGNLRYEQGRLDEARGMYERALAICHEVRNQRFVATALSELARLLLDQGDVHQARAFYDEALQLQRQVGDRQAEADTMARRAGLERRAGEIDEAERLVGQAEPILRELGAQLHLGLCLCERGHQSLARGRASPGFLAEAQRLAAASHAGPGSGIGLAIGRLARAIATFEAGQPLIRGEAVDDLPEGLRHWLVQTGGLASGSSEAPGTQ